MTALDGGRTKQELSAAILRTANDLFNEHGVECVSMHQIAKSCGIGQGTLYRRYANKGDLCMDVMKESFNQFTAEINDYLTSHSEQPVQERLFGVTSRVIRFLEQKSRFLGVVQASSLGEQPKIDFFDSPPYHFLHSTINHLMKEAEANELAHPIDCNYAAHAYISVMTPHTHLHLRHNCGYSLPDVIEHFRRLLIAPLFKKTE